MLDTAKYVNHLNQSIDFGSGGIFITDSELRDYKWKYDTDYDEITNFRKGVKEKKMKIIISVATEEEGIAKKNAIFRIFEADILANQAGKLYQDGYYLNCYITASKKDDFIKTLNEINNTYRTLISVFVVATGVKIYDLFFYDMIQGFGDIGNSLSLLIVFLLIIILFVNSYRKQTDYIKKRVEKALSDQGKNFNDGGEIK